MAVGSLGVTSKVWNFFIGPMASILSFEKASVGHIVSSYMSWIYKDFFTKMRKNSIFEKISKNFVDMTPRFQESGKGILDHLSSKYEVIWPDRSIQDVFRSFREECMTQNAKKQPFFGEFSNFRRAQRARKCARARNFFRFGFSIKNRWLLHQKRSKNL